MLPVSVLFNCLYNGTNFLTQGTLDKGRVGGWGQRSPCHGLGWVILTLKRQTTQSGGQLDRSIALELRR